MRVAPPSSLAFRLAATILIMGGAVLLVLTELNRRAIERILANQAEVQAAVSTAAVADGLDSVAGAAERLARLVARDMAGRTPAAGDLERIARGALIDHEQVLGFSIAFEPFILGAGTERAGVYVHRSNAPGQFVARDLTAADQQYWTRDWYREAIEKEVPVWGEPFLDQGGADRNVVRIAVPILREAGDELVPIGVAAAVIELDWLRRLVNLNEFSDTSFAIVFSRTGRLLVHPDPAATSAETVESLAERTSVPELADIRQRILARRQGSLFYTEPLTGRTVHVNFKPTRTAGWGVIVGYDESEFLGSQRAFRRIALQYVGAVLLLFGGIVIGVTRHALRPLRALSLAAGEIARRNLDCPVEVPRRMDEVGNLAVAFRDMRDALKEQHRERTWSLKALEHQLHYNQLIIDSVGELVFVLTKSLNITRINRTVTSAAGYESAALIRAPLSRVVRLASQDGTEARTGLAPLAAALESNRTVEGEAAQVVARDGRVLDASLTLSPLLDENRVVGAVVTIRLGKPDRKGPVPGAA